jgi:hypothetical protein
VDGIACGAVWSEGGTILAQFIKLRQFGETFNLDNGRAGERRVLSFDRDVESTIYNGLPDHLETYFKRHPLKCKVALVGGLQSRELKQVGLDFSSRVTHGRVMRVNGTHLFPMEHPLVAAAAVETALLNPMV